MRIGQFFYPSNQLTLLRLIFIPFVVLSIVYGQYRTAFVLVLIAGISDGMDGLLARTLGQQTTLGRILDPLADKLLLNSAFAALGFAQQIPLWLVILVFSRDLIIITISSVMILVMHHKPFSPSSYSKMNTVAQVATVLLTLLALMYPSELLSGLQVAGVYSTAGLTIASGLQYASSTAERMRGVDQATPDTHEAGLAENIQHQVEHSDTDSPIGENRLH